MHRNGSEVIAARCFAPGNNIIMSVPRAACKCPRSLMRPYASLEFSYWYDLHELVFSAFVFLLSHFSMCMFLFACSVLIHAVNISETPCLIDTMRPIMCLCAHDIRTLCLHLHLHAICSSKRSSKSADFHNRTYPLNRPICRLPRHCWASRNPVMQRTVV